MNTRPMEERIAIGRKGGLVRSQRKKDAAKLRAIKKMNPSTIRKRSLELAVNEEASSIEIMQWIQELMKNGELTNNQKIKLIDKLIYAHSAIHGAKNKNINLNIDTTAGTVLDRLKEWKKNEVVENGGDNNVEKND